MKTGVSSAMLLVLLWTHPVSASIQTTVTNFTGDSALAIVTLSDLGLGNILVNVDATGSPSGGGIRGVFFDIINETLLAAMSVSGSNVASGSKFMANGASNLGNGVLLTPQNYFDVGIKIGSDPAKLTSTTFTLMATGLGLADFAQQRVGVRVKETGGREESSKLIGTFPQLPPPPPAPLPPTGEIPEPSTVLIWGFLAAMGFALFRHRRNHTPVLS